VLAPSGSHRYVIDYSNSFSSSESVPWPNSGEDVQLLIIHNHQYFIGLQNQCKVLPIFSYK
jgi:hypothetical protein